MINWLLKNFLPKKKPLTKFSRYFTLSELCRSQTATRLNINNAPDEWQTNNLQQLAQNVLDPIRKKFGPFSPNSAFRSYKLNLAIGGAPNSQHMKGMAADIEIPGVSNLDLFNWIKGNLTYDQLILEYHNSAIPDSGWVHVSYRDCPRMQAFKIS